MPEGTQTIEPPLTKTLIPQDLHDRAYLKPWLDKPFTPELAGEVFKKLDGAESLIGKKGGIPENADDVAGWEPVLAKMRPAKADDYVLERKEGSAVDEELAKAFKESLFEGSVSKTQAARIQKKLFAAIDERHQKLVDQQKKLDTDFEKVTKDIWGNEQPKVMEQVNGWLNEFVPDALKPHISRLDNNALAILAGAMKGIVTKYGVEDKGGAGKGGAGSGGAKGVEELRAEARELMAKPGYKDAWAPDHETIGSRIKAIYDEIGALQKK